MGGSQTTCNTPSCSYRPAGTATHVDLPGHQHASPGDIHVARHLHEGKAIWFQVRRSLPPRRTVEIPVQVHRARRAPTLNFFMGSGAWGVQCSGTAASTCGQVSIRLGKILGGHMNSEWDPLYHLGPTTIVMMINTIASD